jgi:hypothetical protein
MQIRLFSPWKVNATHIYEEKSTRFFYWGCVRVKNSPRPRIDELKVKRIKNHSHYSCPLLCRYIWALTFSIELFNCFKSLKKKKF